MSCTLYNSQVVYKQLSSTSNFYCPKSLTYCCTRTHLRLVSRTNRSPFISLKNTSHSPWNLPIRTPNGRIRHTVHRPLVVSCNYHTWSTFRHYCWRGPRLLPSEGTRCSNTLRTIMGLFRSVVLVTYYNQNCEWLVPFTHESRPKLHLFIYLTVCNVESQYPLKSGTDSGLSETWSTN